MLQKRKKKGGREGEKGTGAWEYEGKRKKEMEYDKE